MSAIQLLLSLALLIAYMAPTVAAVSLLMSRMHVKHVVCVALPKRPHRCHHKHAPAVCCFLLIPAGTHGAAILALPVWPAARRMRQPGHHRRRQLQHRTL